jgi:hypothetical protein
MALFDTSSGKPFKQRFICDSHSTSLQHPLTQKSVNQPILERFIIFGTV